MIKQRNKTLEISATFFFNRGGSRNDVNQKRGDKKDLKLISERKRDKSRAYATSRKRFSHACKWMDGNAFK